MMHVARAIQKCSDKIIIYATLCFPILGKTLHLLWHGKQYFHYIVKSSHLLKLCSGLQVNIHILAYLIF